MKNKIISESLNGYPVFGCMYPTNSIIKLNPTTMEKVSVSKELMQSIHKYFSECVYSEHLKEIESELPELFKPKFEVGKWYKCDGGLYFFRIYKIEANRFHYDNDENDEKRFFCLPSHFYDHSIPATPQEIENHLIKLAKKKGFKAGVTISKDGINSRFDFTFRPINGSFSYNSGADILDSGWGHVYQAGQWATIVEEPKTIDRKAEVSKAFRELQNRVDDLLNNL